MMWGRRERGMFAPLFTNDKGWTRVEATILAARTAADMADAEAALLAECALGGRSVELLGSSDVDQVRIYRIGAQG